MNSSYMPSHLGTESVAPAAVPVPVPVPDRRVVLDIASLFPFAHTAGFPVRSVLSAQLFIFLELELAIISLANANCEE